MATLELYISNSPKGRKEDKTMLELLIDVSSKLFKELLITIGVIAIAISVLWLWDKINPQSFEKVLEKVARYFK